MTSKETIEKRLERLAQEIGPDETLIENVMCRINESSISGPSINLAQNIWRVIMKSPITKLAAAAVIIIACVIGSSLWRSTGSGIALADVLTRIEQVTGYTYQMSSTIKTSRQPTSSKWTSNVLVSKENGIKMTITSVDPDGYQGSIRWLRRAVGDEIYLLPQQNYLITVRHKEKRYVRYKYDSQLYEYYKEEYNEPRIVIKQILSCEHKSLGQSVIDDITVEGFQTTDLAYGGGFFGFGETDLSSEPKKVNVNLWADVNTFLPVRLEEDIVTNQGTHMHEVSYDFRWNVIVNPDDFDPNIPEDYRARVGDIIIPVPNEENAIRGLKLFSNAVGKYPASLERRTLSVEYTNRTGFDPNSFKELSHEEKTEKTSEIILLAMTSIFYEKVLVKDKYNNMVVKDRKDPAYYGEMVKPGDTDKVLMRWKLDDGRYRVIFGDLHTEIVTADMMKELEMVLQQ